MSLAPYRPSYVAYRYYDATLDREAERLSMPDPHGREFFATIEVVDAPSYRRNKAKALEQILDAILEGAEPGEVKIR